MIGEKRQPHTFCVKYSDFCKCRKCEETRSKFDNIGPENQKLQDRFLGRKERRVAPERRHGQSSKEPKSPKSILKNRKYDGDRCLPFSQLYSQNDTINTIENFTVPPNEDRRHLTFQIKAPSVLLSQHQTEDSPQSQPVALQRTLTCGEPVRINSKQDLSLNPLSKHPGTFDSRVEASTIYTYNDVTKNQLSSLDPQLLRGGRATVNSILNDPTSRTSLQGFNCVNSSQDGSQHLLSQEVKLKERAIPAVNFTMNHSTTSFDLTGTTDEGMDPLNAPAPKSVDKSVPTRVKISATVLTKAASTKGSSR
jgi:hypothetical protein